MPEILAPPEQFNHITQLAQQEWQQLQRLLEAARSNAPIDAFVSQVALYAHPDTRQILDASTNASAVLGYPREALLALTLDDVEAPHPAAQQTVRAYQESDVSIVEYDGTFRHADGRLLDMHVQKRSIVHEGRPVLRALLDELSLSRRLAGELLRREASSTYQFSEKLKTLNEIQLELGAMPSFDDVCRRGVALGVERLGFDRMSLWFLEEETGMMCGTYGIDEAGNLRDERAQQWDYRGSFVVDFVEGGRQPRIQQHAPIYNDRTEVIGYGWHVSAPIVDAGRFIGFIACDNYLGRQPMHGYQPELLRLYGASIGHIASRQRERETIRRLRQQEMELRLEQERGLILKNFVRDVGHEFRTPLAVISVSSYLLTRLTDADARATHITQIQQQQSYLNKMVDDMLYIIQLGAGHDAQPQAVDLAALARANISVLEQVSSAKGIVWCIEMEATRPVPGDADQLGRAILELLRNAVEYSHDGGTVSVRLAQDDEGVRLSVQDGGIGIDPADHQRIFNRFYRVNEARTTRGSGLGLSIARLIVDGHGGDISVDSAPGRGSLFTITLPAPVAPR
ncbi:MAG: HAMP domain-containing histidine kinase [Pleurocapsa minor GSE-CHR-MK-17-07R]|nr:HAMP domain-containing histidine kinase [Pleurocapsa minor GSE-CHR-MK 17-07R]